MIKLTKMQNLWLLAVLFLPIVFCLMPYYAFGQGGTPLPGAAASISPTNNADAPTIPLPGSSSLYQAVGNPNWTRSSRNGSQTDLKSSYQFLPISADDAKTRIDELKTLILVSKPQELKDRVDNLCEWLAELTDAHLKLANVFSRQDSTKAKAQAEKSQAQRFAKLKNEAVLLKAELLLKLNRTPEALAPLVDIVIADPKGAVGEAAYQHLKEIGFSCEVSEISTAVPAAEQDQENIVLFPKETQISAKRPPVGTSAPVAKVKVRPKK